MIKEVDTYTVRLYIAGDINTAKRWLNDYCYNNGLCVTVEPTTFIYTGGEESGMVIGFVKYPRFSKKPSELFGEAKYMAELLLAALNQQSCLLVCPDKTTWISNRREDNPL